MYKLCEIYIQSVQRCQLVRICRNQTELRCSGLLLIHVLYLLELNIAKEVMLTKEFWNKVSILKLFLMDKCAFIVIVVRVENGN